MLKSSLVTRTSLVQTWTFNFDYGTCSKSTYIKCKLQHLLDTGFSFGTLWDPKRLATTLSCQFDLIQTSLKSVGLTAMGWIQTLSAKKRSLALLHLRM